MPSEPAIAILSRLASERASIFSGRNAVSLGVGRNRLRKLLEQGVIERLHPDVYRMTAVAPSARQRLHAALLWAGESAAAAGRSAAELYRLEGVHATTPEIVLPPNVRGRVAGVQVYHADPKSLMVRTVDGIRVTGVEATIVRLGSILDEQAFEIAFDDARRRRLTSLPAVDAYLDRFGKRAALELRQRVGSSRNSTPCTRRARRSR